MKTWHARKQKKDENGRMPNFGKSTRWKNGRITRHLIITYFKSRIFGWVFGPDRSNWYKWRDPKICYSSDLPFFFPRVRFPKFFRSSLFLGVPVFTSVNFRKRWTIIIKNVKENREIQFIYIKLDHQSAQSFCVWILNIYILEYGFIYSVSYWILMFIYAWVPTLLTWMLV